MEEAAIPDAGMMDTSMDDLFGDPMDGLSADLNGDLASSLNNAIGPGLAVPLPQIPLPIESILRISEMQSRGCCSKLAWANTGSIARISDGGTKITFHAMIRDRKTGEWHLSDENRHAIDAPDGRQFVHVQFSPLGIDMAVVDHVGGVHMYNLVGGLGRMGLAPGDVAHAGGPKTELDSVVGMHYLPLFPTEFRAPYLPAAVKNGNKYEAHLRSRSDNNVKAHHPAEGKLALVHITRCGTLTLLYQNEGHGWQSTSIPLETIRASSEFISHADIGEDGADLLVITYDQSSRFRLYRISINWNANQQTRGPNMQYMLVAPTLDVHHLTACENVRVQSIGSAKLTHLRLIAAVNEVAQTGLTLPTIVAVFTHAANAMQVVSEQSSFSVIARWHIESITPTLHDSFKKLKSSGDSTSVLNTVTVLRRQPDVRLNNVVLCFESLVLDTIYAFGTSDGGLDMRDRQMDEIRYSGDINAIAGLPQAGFAHAAGAQNIHVAMSADGAALALIRPGGKLCGQLMTFERGWQALDDDSKPFVEAAAACVAREFTLLALQNVSSDEALALLPPNSSPELRSMVVRSILRFIGRGPVDALDAANKQQLYVLKEPLVPRSLSAQLSLGTNHTNGDRDAGAQFAFIMLSLRTAGGSLVQTTTNPNVRTTSPEALLSLRGTVKWVTDLMIYIASTLVEARNIAQAGSSHKEALEQIRSTQNNAAAHILLCTSTRVALRLSLKHVGAFLQYLQAAQQRARSVAEVQQVTATLGIASSIPFKYQDVEVFFGELDKCIRETYQRSALPADRRSEIEIALMTDGAIPAELDPVLSALLDSLLPKLLETTDMSSLYFWNTRTLAISSSEPVEGQYIDVIRKMPIPKGAPLRRCRRCGSVTEDLSPEKVREQPPWLMHAQRHCICMNYWLVL